MPRYKLTREVPTLREAEIASVARYERLFTRYLLGHFDEDAHDDDGNDDPLLAEVAASAVVTAHNHVLRRWLRAGGQGDVEAQLDHAFAIVRETFGTGIGAGRTAASAEPPRGVRSRGRGAGDGGPDGRPARRGHAHHRAGAQRNGRRRHEPARQPGTRPRPGCCEARPVQLRTITALSPPASHRSSLMRAERFHLRAILGTQCLAA